MVVNVANILGTIGGVAALGLLVWFALKGSPEREEEDAARAFFDEHGRWPDEG